MKDEEIFGEFEEFIVEKYGHIADDMLMLLDDFSNFFFENEIGLKDFKKGHVRALFEEELCYDDLNQAEASMLFQTLIEFCDFVSKKGIDISFFKSYLLKNKFGIYEDWTEEEEFEASSPKMDPTEFLDNFDAFYAMAKMMKGRKKIDLSKTIGFLEKTHKLMQLTFEESQKIRQNNPHLSEKEYLKRLDDEVDAKYGKELFANIPSPDDMPDIIFSLPKEQARKFIELTFKIGETSNF